MRAAILNSYGPDSKFEITEVATPEAQPGQACRGCWCPFQYQRGISMALTAGVILQVKKETVRRRLKPAQVVHIHGIEWRHMHLLGEPETLVFAGAVGLEHIQDFLPPRGIGYLKAYGFERAILSIAIENGQRVHHESPVAQMRQQRDLSLWAMASCRLDLV